MLTLGTAKVDVLKGVGKVMTKKLASHKIFTVNDLLQREKEELLKIPVHDTIIESAMQYINNKYEVKCHSWRGLYAHLPLHLANEESITTVRVCIGPMTISPYCITLEVFWRKNGVVKKKAVSPTFLAASHLLHETKEIVSEDSDEESHPVIQTRLPQLSVQPEGSELMSAQDALHRALKLNIREVNNLLAVFYT